MSQFGVTPQGFVTKDLQTIQSEIQATLQLAFGQNIDLSPQSNFGQLVGIFAEREALLWELAEAVFTSQYPSGAEGTSVDNILALTNLRRVGAQPTRTNPTPLNEPNGTTKFGLVLFGSPGTAIVTGSIIQTNASPPLQFSLDQTVTIASAINCIQNLFFSNTPNTGAFQLTFTDQDGTTMNTSSMSYLTQDVKTQISFSSVPGSGNFKISLTKAGATLTTANIPSSANAATVQAAINALSGYSGVTVTGSFGAGFVISYPAGPIPTVSTTANTLGVTITVIDALQGQVNNLLNSNSTKYPFTDVQVAASASGFTFSFGVLTPVGSNPSSAAISIPLIIIAANSMQMGSNVTNLKAVMTTQGFPAQGVGTATCKVTGPNFVKAGSLNTIGTPTSGWTGVSNQLDCLTGSNTENDTQAMTRRTNELQANANGPLAEIIDKVSLVPNVTTCIGFENVYDASNQIITYSGTPTTGHYQIQIGALVTANIPYTDTAAQIQTAIRLLAGYGSVLVTGDANSGFVVDFNGSFGGQEQPTILLVNNTMDVTPVQSYGRPGHSFEIVAQGGDDTVIAQTILASKPGGIKAYGSTIVTVFDQFGNPYSIGFSRPTPVTIFVSIVLQTDLTSLNPKFNPGSVATIQQDIVEIGNEFGIGGLIIGFGSNGLIGAFNSVPGIQSYTLFFGTAPNPVTNTNIQMQPEQTPAFETFNVAVSYT